MVSPHTPEERLQLALDRGILVDDQDRWLLYEYTWYVGDNDYVRTSIHLGWDNDMQRSVQILPKLHHCIIGQPIWEGDEIDHINHNPKDNRRCNLRYVTRSQNRINTTRVAGLSGSRNIYIEENGMYRVTIRRDGMYHHLGVFTTLDEAAATRDEWLHNYHGERQSG